MNLILRSQRVLLIGYFYDSIPSDAIDEVFVIHFEARQDIWVKRVFQITKIKLKNISVHRGRFRWIIINSLSNKFQTPVLKYKVSALFRVRLSMFFADK